MVILIVMVVVGRLIACVAEDASSEDAIYFLEKALSKQKIDSATFLKASAEHTTQKHDHITNTTHAHGTTQLANIQSRW